jgi:hypothetical protein
VGKSTRDVSRALSWCYIALRQAERTRESFAAYEAAGREHSQLEFLYWGDAHFLISATHHMNEALKGLSIGPKLPKRLRDQITGMRHLIEHWDDEEERRGTWKTLAEKHGKHASPWVAVGDDNDLRIGPDFFHSGNWNRRWLVLATSCYLGTRRSRRRGSAQRKCSDLSMA